MRPVVASCSLLALLLAGTHGPATAESPLRPVPEPFIENLEPAVQELLRAGRARLDALLEDPGADPEELALAFGELGEMSLYYNLHEGAEAALRNARELAPGDPRWHYLLASQLRADGRLEEAEGLFRMALELLPDDVPTLVRLGQVLQDLGRLEEAIDLFEEALAIEATAGVHYALGRALLEEGRPDEAIPHFQRTLELAPDADVVHHQLGLALRRLGHEEEARRHLAAAGTGKVLFPDPLWDAIGRFATGFSAHFSRGNRAFEQGNLEVAVAEYRRALEIEPENASGHLNLGTALARLGNQEQALEHFLRSTTDSRTALIAHLNSAHLLADQGRHAEAVEHFRSVLARRSDLPMVRYNLATALGHLGRLAEAAEEYARVAAASPGDEPTWLALATALALAGREGEARDRLEEGLGHLPESQVLRHALARLLATAEHPVVRDGERALAIALELHGSVPEPEIVETVAMAFAELGRFDEAVQWQERAAAATTTTAREPARRRLDGYRRAEPARAPWRETGILVEG